MNKEIVGFVYEYTSLINRSIYHQDKQVNIVRRIMYGNNDVWPRIGMRVYFLIEEHLEEFCDA